MANIIYPESKNKYRNKNALPKVINYINDEEKTPHNIKGALGCNYHNSKSTINDMRNVQKHFRNEKGKKIIHFIISFSKEEQEHIQIDDFLTIGYQIAQYFPNEYQIFFALHENTENYHIHFGMNPVSYETGKKYHWQKKDSYNLKCLLSAIMADMICES